MSSDDSRSGGRGHANRFVRGKSGNPRGRPKGSRNTKTIVRELAAKTHVVNNAGTTRCVTTVELILLAARDRAMSGDVRVAKYLEDLKSRMVPDDSGAGYLVVPEAMSKEQWIAEQEKLNTLRSMPTID